MRAKVIRCRCVNGSWYRYLQSSGAGPAVSTPDTYPDLFAGYAVVWACLFLSLGLLMKRGWSLEKRLQLLETARPSMKQVT